MPDSLNLEIAGINLVIASDGLSIVRHSDPAYERFFITDRARSADIDIRIKTEPMPDTREMNKIFDSGESWSLFRSGQASVLIFQPPVFDQPYLIAEMTHSFAKVVIYCSEHLINRIGDTISVSNPVQYPLDQIILMHYLTQKQGALIHAAGLAIDGCGYIFPGRSGAGKSTVSRQFLDRNDFHLLSDDRIIVRKTDGIFTVFGTPWPGDEGIADNGSSLLSGIFFLSHGDTNRIEEIAPQKALELLLAVTSIPWYEKEDMIKALAFCEDVTSHVRSYKLQFRPDTEVSDFFHEFHSGVFSAKSL